MTEGMPEDPFEEGEPSIALSTEMLEWKFLWDIVPDELIPATAISLGLNPQSPEVSWAEQQGYQKKLETIAPLIPLLNTFSTVASDVVIASILVSHGEDEDFLDEEMLDEVSRTVVLGVIMELMSNGILVFSENLVIS